MIRSVDLHPIMYVDDQYAEREFYELLGFERSFEGDEFPGFLAVRRGNAVFGLQRCSAEHPAYTQGLRWQFEVATSDELSALREACVTHGLDYEVMEERGGDRFITRIIKVVSPGGVTVWFEAGTGSAP